MAKKIQTVIKSATWICPFVHQKLYLKESLYFPPPPISKNIAHIIDLVSNIHYHVLSVNAELFGNALEMFLKSGSPHSISSPGNIEFVLVHLSVHSGKR